MSRALPIVTIVVISLVLTPLIRALTCFEKHRSRIRAACVAAWALLVAGFLNSAIALLVANTFVLGLRSLLEKTWIGPWVMLGIYSDLTPGWYGDVGRILMLAQLLGCACRLLRLGWSIWHTKSKRRNAWKSLTQRDLNKALMGPEVRALYPAPVCAVVCVLTLSLDPSLSSSLWRTAMASTWRWSSWPWRSVRPCRCSSGLPVSH